MERYQIEIPEFTNCTNDQCEDSLWNWGHNRKLWWTRKDYSAGLDDTEKTNLSLTGIREKLENNTDGFTNTFREIIEGNFPNMRLKYR